MYRNACTRRREGGDEGREEAERELRWRERERERTTDAALSTHLIGRLPFFSTSTSRSKKKKKASSRPTNLRTTPTTMADCGCAPKCACGAEKIGASSSSSFGGSDVNGTEKLTSLSPPPSSTSFHPQKKKKKKPTASAAAPPAARSAAARSARARRRRPSEGTAALGARVAAPGAALAAPGASARPRAALRRPKEKSNEAEEGRGDVLISVGFFLSILVGPKRKKRGENNKKGKKIAEFPLNNLVFFFELLPLPRAAT